MFLGYSTSKIKLATPYFFFVFIMLLYEEFNYLSQI